MTADVLRFSIDQWRSSLPLDHVAPSTAAIHDLSHLRRPSASVGATATISSSSSSSSLSLPRPSRPHHHLHPATTSPDSDDVAIDSGSDVDGSCFKGGKRQEADRLVDATLKLLNITWSTSSDSDSDSDGSDTVPLRTFVNEILRRSRSSCATLRAARWYLQRAASLLDPSQPRPVMLACPRRTFLSSLILANKFLHDRVYSNRAWGKVSGLLVSEISQGEAALGDLLEWSLWVGREPDSMPVAVVQAEAKLDALAPPLVPLADFTSDLAPRVKANKRHLGPVRASEPVLVVSSASPSSSVAVARSDSLFLVASSSSSSPISASPTSVDGSFLGGDGSFLRPHASTGSIFSQGSSAFGSFSSSGSDSDPSSLDTDSDVDVDLAAGEDDEHDEGGARKKLRLDRPCDVDADGDGEMTRWACEVLLV